jgi:hypothetical protein
MIVEFGDKKLVIGIASDTSRVVELGLRNGSVAASGCSVASKCAARLNFVSLSLL